MAKQRFLNNFTSTFIAAVKDAPSSGTPETELDYGVLRISDGAAGALINPTDGDYYLLTAFKRLGSVESNIEVMRVTGVNNAIPGECRITVQRAQEGTSAKAFVAGDYLSLRITKGTAENFSQPADLATKEPVIAAPVSAPTEKYWRGDKTWRDFFTDVRAATLTGLSTATNAVVAATDTVLAAIGKLQAQVSTKFDKTGGDVDGNINFTGTARRITGDFSNATIANRTLFQTGVANDATDLTIVPNGTATYAAVSARSSDSANASVAALAVNEAAVTLVSHKTGSGAYLPLTFIVGNAERLRVDPTTGNVLATSGGAIGYGVGAGGTVTQATSKSTAVTLNKPTGQVTMNNEALGAGTGVFFQLNNSLISGTDTVQVATFGGGASYLANCVSVSAGAALIRVVNNTAGSLSDSVILNFAIIKGATS